MPHCTTDFAWYLGKFIVGFTGMLFLYIGLLKEEERIRNQLRMDNRNTNSCTLDDHETSDSQRVCGRQCTPVDAQDHQDWCLRATAWLWSQMSSLARTARKITSPLGLDPTNNHNESPSVECTCCSRCLSQKILSSDSMGNSRRIEVPRSSPTCLCRRTKSYEKLARRKRKKYPCINLHVSQEAICGSCSHRSKSNVAITRNNHAIFDKVSHNKIKQREEKEIRDEGSMNKIPEEKFTVQSDIDVREYEIPRGEQSTENNYSLDNIRKVDVGLDHNAEETRRIINDASQEELPFHSTFIDKKTSIDKDLTMPDIHVTMPSIPQDVSAIKNKAEESSSMVEKLSTSMNDDTRHKVEESIKTVMDKDKKGIAHSLTLLHTPLASSIKEQDTESNISTLKASKIVDETKQEVPAKVTQEVHTQITDVPERKKEFSTINTTTRPEEHKNQSNQAGTGFYRPYELRRNLRDHTYWKSYYYSPQRVLNSKQTPQKIFSPYSPYTKYIYQKLESEIKSNLNQHHPKRGIHDLTHRLQHPRVPQSNQTRLRPQFTNSSYTSYPYQPRSPRTPLNTNQQQPYRKSPRICQCEHPKSACLPFTYKPKLSKTRVTVKASVLSNISSDKKSYSCTVLPRKCERVPSLGSSCSSSIIERYTVRHRPERTEHRYWREEYTSHSPCYNHDASEDEDKSSESNYNSSDTEKSKFEEAEDAKNPFKLNRSHLYHRNNGNNNVHCPRPHANIEESRACFTRRTKEYSWHENKHNYNTNYPINKSK